MYMLSTLYHISYVTEFGEKTILLLFGFITFLLKSAIFHGNTIFFFWKSHKFFIYLIKKFGSINYCNDE